MSHADPPLCLGVHLPESGDDAEAKDRWLQFFDASLALARSRRSRPIEVTFAPDVAAATAGGLVLFANPAQLLSPSCLAALIEALEPPEVGLVESRRLPFQSLKPVDPDTGEISWASSCYLIKGEVLASVGGPDREALPGVSADIDLSWRARLTGWQVRLAPQAAVYDPRPVPGGDPYLAPEPEAALARLCLAARLAGPEIAAAWAAAMSLGDDSERSAARRFEARSSKGRLPARIEAPPADTDALLQELFNLGKWPTGERDLSTADLWPSKARTSAWAVGARAAAPFLSVIVRTQGRRPKALEDCILSLVGQGCDDIEILVAGHDLDPDTRRVTQSLLKSFPESVQTRMRLIEVEGGSRSRPLNVALGHVTGDYVAFLDDDDLALPGWVEGFESGARAVAGAVAWTAVAWQTHTTTTGELGDHWAPIEPPQLFVRKFNLAEHLVDNGTPNCGIAIPRRLIEDHQLRFREDLSVFEDWELVLRLAELAPFVNTGYVTALYRRGSPDNSGEVQESSDWDVSARDLLAGFEGRGYRVRGEHFSALVEALKELDELRRSGGPGGGGELEPARTEHSLARLGELRVAVISPHMDDAVLSCGELIAVLPGTTAITVLGAGPSVWEDVTGWDELCGFGPGADVVAARAGEDDDALARLGATGVRLRFWDEQYRPDGDAPDRHDIALEVIDALSVVGAQAVFVPLGLVSSDHMMVSAGCRRAIQLRPDLEWFAYQDLPYAYEEGDLVIALARYDDLGPEPVHIAASAKAAKEQALDCYPSQMRGLGAERRANALRAERFWRLHPDEAVFRPSE